MAKKAARRRQPPKKRRSNEELILAALNGHGGRVICHENGLHAKLKLRRDMNKSDLNKAVNELVKEGIVQREKQGKKIELTVEKQ